MEKDELAELGGDELVEIIIGVGVDAGVIMDASPNIVDSSQGFRLRFSLSFRFISS